MAKALKIGFAQSRLYFASAMLLMTLAGISSTIKPAHAQSIESDWWFDVEFIAFKRDLLPGHPEDFTQSDFEFDNGLTFDLFTLELLKRENPTFRLLASLGPCEETDTFAALQNIPLASELAQGLVSDAQSFIDISKLDSAQGAIQTVSAQDPMLINFIDAQTWIKDDVAGPPPLLCKDEAEYEPIQAAPEQFFANYPYVIGRHSLLTNKSLYLSSYAKRVFAQRDISPIMYTAWRQPVVFGEDKAAFYKVFGGQNVVIESTELEGSSNDETSDISQDEFVSMTLEQLNILDQDLAQPSPVQWEDTPSAQDSNDTENGAEQAQAEATWELDGLFKVYLENVNRVPYLHIDSQFKHTRIDIDANGEAQLESFASKQRRRVISKQIHYFDHPAFGIIVRLERFEVPPTQPEIDNTLVQ